MALSRPRDGFDSRTGYHFNFLYMGPLTALAFYFHYRTYRAWKRLGADTAYVPPEKGFRLGDLPPHPKVDGRVPPGLVGVTALAFAGQVVGGAIWMFYYGFREPNPFHVAIFATAMAVQLALYLAYLRFVRFMERP